MLMLIMHVGTVFISLLGPTCMFDVNWNSDEMVDVVVDVVDVVVISRCVGLKRPAEGTP